MFYELSKFTNIYFVVTMIFQSIPQISTLNPLSAVFPVLTILILAILREGYEDYQRYKKDQKINQGLARVYNPDSGRMEIKLWEQIREGDLVLMIENEETPADLLLLYSKSASAYAYIETSNLDGEKNLKPKLPIRKYKSNQAFSKPDVDKFRLSYPFPNPNIYSFEGYVDDDGQKKHLTKDNFIPRAVRIKNTRLLVGLALYVGNDTKLMKNYIKKKNKVSSLQKMMNVYVLILVVVEILLLLVLGIGGVITISEIEISDYNKIYASQRPSPVTQFFVLILSYFILLNTFLPVSLIVTIEMVRYVQKVFYVKDSTFTDEDGQGLWVNTVTLNEELGKIEYVLSDKTGTLTKNQMKAKRFCVGFNKISLDKNLALGEYSRQVHAITPMVRKVGYCWGYWV